jgi:hypothetical protein
MILFFPFTSRAGYDNNFEMFEEEWNLIEDWVKDYYREAPAGVTLGYFLPFSAWWPMDKSCSRQQAATNSEP